MLNQSIKQVPLPLLSTPYRIEPTSPGPADPPSRDRFNPSLSNPFPQGPEKFFTIVFESGPGHNRVDIAVGAGH